MKRHYAILLLFLLIFSQVYAENKQWSGKLDALNWDKDANWFPAGAPTSSDTATVDTEGSSVLISKTFSAASLNIGGRTESALTAADFVSGEISPPIATSNGLYIRKGGNLILRGAGTVTLSGTFKNTEEELPDEPAFMFEAQ